MANNEEMKANETALDSDKREKFLSVRVNDEIKNTIKQCASSRNMNISEYIMYACYTTESIADKLDEITASIKALDEKISK